MTRKEQHKARKRKEKGHYYYGAGVICTLVYVAVNSTRIAAFYKSKVEED